MLIGYEKYEFDFKIEYSNKGRFSFGTITDESYYETLFSSYSVKEMSNYIKNYLEEMEKV